MAGHFISFEGGEGSGKTTQIRLLANWLRQKGLDVIETREPGGTEGAETIRNLLLDGEKDRWQARSEALLFAAARSDHVETLINPALAADKWVLSDRYLDSSRAYQSAGSGLDDADILSLHDFGSKGLLPHMTILLNLPQDAAKHRLAARDGDKGDRIQTRDLAFHEKVHDAFLQYAKEEPERFRLVDATGSIEAVHSTICEHISALTE